MFYKIFGFCIDRQHIANGQRKIIHMEYFSLDKYNKWADLYTIHLLLFLFWLLWWCWVLGGYTNILLDG